MLWIVKVSNIRRIFLLGSAYKHSLGNDVFNFFKYFDSIAIREEMFVHKLFRRQQSTQPNEEFDRCLSLFDLTLISITSSIGSGIYVLTGRVSKDYAGKDTITDQTSFLLVFF
jgi:hypothetical protein